jgi:primosomal protein N' (replication factor Y)
MRAGYAICHYCMARTLVPKVCPLCSKNMTMIGLGSQRLEEELNAKLSAARVMRVDSDAMSSGGAAGYYKLLGDFAAGRIDVLAGTQILAKGLHFPNVTLVGIISADTSLSLPDFRANERTYQLISQVAGRAGRSEKGGTVIVQTFMPSSKAIKYAVDNDFKGFVKEELTHRSKCGLPPVGRMAIVGLKDEKFDKLTVACDAMRARLDELIDFYGLDLKIRGPMPATISRVQRFHRMQIIVQGSHIGAINRLFAAWRAGPPIRPVVKIAVDVDPINIL